VSERNDEISLVDLWRIIVEKKRIIILTWLVFVCIAVIYTFIAKPVYQAEVFLLPPSQKDIQALNVSLPSQGDRSDRSDRSDSAAHYVASEVYDLFVQTLKSRANRRTFYANKQVAEKLGATGDIDTERFFEEAFNKKLVVSRNVKKEDLANFTSISLSISDAELSAQWLNQFVEDTSLLVAKQLADEVSAKVESHKLALKDAIKAKLQLAEKRRHDRIVALQEALVASKSLSEDEKHLQVKMRARGLAINTESFPLYMLSPSALAAEIKVLKERKDDAPFIQGLRDLEEGLVTWQQVKVFPDRVKVMSLDQRAFVPKGPAKPKKALIILLAALLGLMLGVVLAFVKEALSTGRGEA